MFMSQNWSDFVQGQRLPNDAWGYARGLINFAGYTSSGGPLVGRVRCFFGATDIIQSIAAYCFSQRSWQTTKQQLLFGSVNCLRGCIEAHHSGYPILVVYDWLR